MQAWGDVASDLPAQLPSAGFVWWAIDQQQLQQHSDTVMSTLEGWTGTRPLDLHVQDLLNAQHPSHHDSTCHDDLLIFRQLVLSNQGVGLASVGRAQGGPPILRHMGTRAVGFLLCDRVLLTVHAPDCQVDDQMRERLMGAGASKMPASAADLMLRMLGHMVDQFLELRQPLSQQLEHWEAELLDPSTRFVNWRALLKARHNLHALEDLCDSQRTTLTRWMRSMDASWASSLGAQRAEGDVLRVRCRDVIEHIDRLVHHVQRLEQNAEMAIQIHFSAQSHRANTTMTTLTVLTAVFLPLNLVTGFFGMNFEYLPLVHNRAGLWWAIGFMAVVVALLMWLFWRNRLIKLRQT
jgi:magnesium transporter